MKRLIFLALCFMLTGCAELWQELPEQTEETTSETGTETDNGDYDMSRTSTTNAVAVASSSIDYGIITAPDHAYDGDWSTYTAISCTNSYYGTANFSFVLDLGSIIPVSLLQYKYGYNNISTNYQFSSIYVSISADGSSWTQIATLSSYVDHSGAHSQTDTYTPSSITNMRYVKFSGAVSYSITVFTLYEIGATYAAVKVNSGKQITTQTATVSSPNLATKGVWLAADKILAGPYRFHSNAGDIKSFYLESPDETDASGLRIKCDPASAFVTSVLGSGSNGIMAVAIWSYFLSTTLKLLEYNFGTSSGYVKFGDTGGTYLFSIMWSFGVTGSENASVTLPTPFESTTYSLVSSSPLLFKNKTASGFVVDSYYGSAKYIWDWVAIGV